MTYRRGGGQVPGWQRRGPDGLDLTRTRVVDQAATDRLIGNGLPVLRVTVDQSGETSPTVEWRYAPTSEQKEQAEELLGASANHAT